MSRAERPCTAKARRAIPAPFTPLQERIEAYDEATGWLRDEPHRKPTAFSLARIEQHFGLRLPRLLVELARTSKSFNSIFASLGPDYQAKDHIIRVNSYWRQRRRTRRAPRSLVILTRGHDAQFWCLDKLETGEAAVQFWCPDGLVYCSAERPVMRYASFDEYLREDVRWRTYWKTQRG